MFTILSTFSKTLEAVAYYTAIKKIGVLWVLPRHNGEQMQPDTKECVLHDCLYKTQEQRAVVVEMRD